MKKSLSKILARMAKDGDIETVAEIIEEMIEPEAAPAEVVGETPTTAGGGNLVGVEVIRNEQSPQCGAATIENAGGAPAAVVETPEGATIVVDEATLGDILSRLDQIISLLTPAAADEDPAEEIAEAVEEAVEAVAAEEEPTLLEVPAEGIQPEEVAEIIEEILEPMADPDAALVDPAEDECEEEQEVLTAGDTLRASLRAVSPALARMPKKQRVRISRDIAARLNRASGRRGADAGAYLALASGKFARPKANPADLGKRIMAKRNANMKKGAF